MDASNGQEKRVTGNRWTMRSACEWLATAGLLPCADKLLFLFGHSYMDCGQSIDEDLDNVVLNMAP
jgi:hypothetical protein